MALCFSMFTFFGSFWVINCTCQEISASPSLSWPCYVLPCGCLNFVPLVNGVYALWNVLVLVYTNSYMLLSFSEKLLILSPTYTHTYIRMNLLQCELAIPKTEWKHCFYSTSFLLHHHHHLFLIFVVVDDDDEPSILNSQFLSFYSLSDLDHVSL